MTLNDARRATNALPEADYRVLRGLCGAQFNRYSKAPGNRDAIRRLTDKGLLVEVRPGDIAIPPATYEAVDLRGAP